MTIKRTLNLVYVNVPENTASFDNPDRPADSLRRWPTDNLVLAIYEWESLGKPFEITLTVDRA